MVHTFNKTKSVLGLVLMLTVMGVSTPTLAQTRHVMLEEFTGAWCGWCVRGALAIQQLRAAYPNQVYAVSFHNDQGSPINDLMSTPQGDTLAAGISTLSSATTVTGFPDGWTARTVEGSSWNIDPGTWIDTANVGNGLAEQMLNDLAQASVTVDKISYDASTGKVSATVNVNFNEAVKGDLRLNLYVIEDSVTGSGNGYDQHNYYYQNSSYPQSPYFNLGTPYFYNGAADGSTIPGFVHMQVFRYSPGPIWGTKGVIPATANPGVKYSQTYTFTIPGNIQNISHVKLLGFVNEYSTSNAANNVILDADMQPLSTEPFLTTDISVSANNTYNIAQSNNSSAANLTVTNNGTSAVTVALAVDPSLVVPAGWSATVTPSSVTVPAGGSQPATLNVTAPDASAFVSIPVWGTPVKQGFLTKTSKDTVFFLSDNTKFALYYDPQTTQNFADNSLLTLADSIKNRLAAIPLTDGSLQSYAPENYPVSIFDNVEILDNGGDDQDLPHPIILPNITAALAAGKRVFISSDDALGYAFDEADGYFSQYSGSTETADVQNFYNKLGISWNSTVRRWNASTGALTSFSVKGTTNDPIGNGISASDRGGFLSEIFTIDSASSSIFYSDNTIANVIGARYVDPTTNGRLVYLGFGLSELTNATIANSIAAKSITWLLGTSAPASLTANPTSLDFGTILPGDTKTLDLTLTNSSSASVTIPTGGLSINPTGSNFTFSGLGLPATILAGGTATVHVTYAPNSVETDIATINISTGGEANTLKVPMQGAASADGVPEVDVNSASLTASPNPFHGTTQVTYTAAANETNVTLVAYDLLGREIMPLPTHVSGTTYVGSLDGSALADGTYVILAHSSKGSKEVRVINQQ